MRYTTLSLCFILFTGFAYAENYSDKLYPAVGFGTITCYEYLHPNRERDFVGRGIHIFSWAQGFMSGKNVYGEYNIDLLSISIEEQEVIMKVYCEEHKRDSVAKAVEFLHEELWRKSKDKLKK